MRVLLSFLVINIFNYLLEQAVSPSLIQFKDVNLFKHCIKTSDGKRVLVALNATSQGVQVSLGLVHKWWEDGVINGQAVWGGICGHTGAVPEPVVKKELSHEAKLSIYRSVYGPSLTSGHEL